MQKLMDIAVANDLVASRAALEAMTDAALLLAVFDAAFDILLHHNPEGNINSKNAPTCVRPHAWPPTLATPASMSGAHTRGRRVSGAASRPIGAFHPTCRAKRCDCGCIVASPSTTLCPFQDISPHVTQDGIVKMPAIQVLGRLSALRDESVFLHRLVPSEGVLIQLPEAKLLAVFAQTWAIWRVRPAAQPTPQGGPTDPFHAMKRVCQLG
ncbi:Aste57867_10693 [Aphanomyces stellatus]|uniref:Aste57867_10693 protein n=1 Tax=Aphanomyces stellatus TaxID=120398 RepID=A0A485KR27_9STRA|nr:hypothetical protein As57867_010653 [Aphanomyces stellatus]VFT87563.1 Aste57867_10693 [Aphanomyces stellatus]